MPSPFPGMDPWLERPALFPNLHNSLIVALQGAIYAVLPAGYVAAGDTRVYVDPELRRIPDIGVFGPDESHGGTSAVAVASLVGAGLIAAATERITDPIEEPYLEIRSVEDERLVTAVEVVSPTNKKPGEDGRTSYRQKQGEFRLTRVNLVEIDLLRGGPHTTAVPEARLRALAASAEYHVSVMLAGSPRQYFVAPIRLADRLPSIPIPLEAGVTPVMVDLQAAFDRCFDEGRFAQRARYDRPPDPPLTAEQQEWAEGLLREKGLLR